MVASTYTTRNASHPSGSAMPRHITTPVRKKPRKNLIFMPCTSAIDPRIGISSAITSEATVCAYPHVDTMLSCPAASSSEFA